MLTINTSDGNEYSDIEILCNRSEYSNPKMVFENFYKFYIIMYFKSFLKIKTLILLNTLTKTKPYAVYCT